MKAEEFHYHLGIKCGQARPFYK